MVLRVLRVVPAIFVLLVSLAVVASPVCGAEVGPTVRAMLSTTIGGPIGLEPVQRAAELGGCQTVRSSPGELVLQFAGMSNNYAYVLSNGGITIAATREVTRLEHMDALDADLLRIYSYIEQVSPDIPDEVKYACLHYNCVYYLSNPGTYKRVVFPPGKYEGTLIVPECQVKEARFTLLPAPDTEGSVEFRGQKLHSTCWGKRERKVHDVTGQLVFGRHSLKLDHGGGLWPRMHLALAVEAITTPTAGRVYFTGNGLEQVIVAKVLPLSGAGPAAPDEPSIAVGGGGPGPGSSEAPRAGGPAVPRAVLREMAEALDDPAKAAPGHPGASEMLAQPLVWLGEYYLGVKQANKAVAMFRGATTVAPELASAQAGLARACKEQGDDEGFTEARARAIELDKTVSLDEPGPLEEPVGLDLGDTLAVAEEMRAATSEDGDATKLEHAVEMLSGLAHCALGWACLSGDDVQAALKEFRAATERGPEFAPGHWGYAEAAAQAGDMDTATKEIEEACRLAPGDKRFLATRQAIYAVVPRVSFVEPKDGAIVRGLFDVKCVCEDNGTVRRMTLYQNGKKIHGVAGSRLSPNRTELGCKADAIRGLTLRCECENMNGVISSAEIKLKR